MFERAIHFGQVETLICYLVEGLSLAGQKQPLCRVRLEVLAIGQQGFRRISFRVNGQGNDPHVGQASHFFRDSAHPAGHHRTGPLAVREDGVCYPNPAFQVVQRYFLAGLRYQLEIGYLPQGLEFRHPVARGKQNRSQDQDSPHTQMLRTGIDTTSSIRIVSFIT